MHTLQTNQNKEKYNIAYVSRLTYPDMAANAIQTIQMAAAFARHNCGIHLFVRDMLISEDTLRQQYGITNSPIRIRSLSMRRWPSFIYRTRWTRSLVYNSAAALMLGFSAGQRSSPEQQNILFIRSEAESLYWGLMRPYLRWLKDWVFICEVHDLKLPLRHKDSAEYDFNSRTAKRLSRALKNYDIVLSLSRGLAEDIHRLANEQIEPHVIPSSTGLPRLNKAPVINLLSNPIILGYIGTLDPQHGVEDLFHAVKLLPENFVLRIIGRVRSACETWFNNLIKDHSIINRVELKPHINYPDIIKEIDGCDILLAPAGNTLHSIKYRSPMKIFDYMARGKPIVAAGVPCHLEILQNSVNALIYTPSMPNELAAQILTLAKNSHLAEAIAKTAWEQSANYTYDMRVEQILKLVDENCGRGNAKQYL